LPAGDRSRGPTTRTVDLAQYLPAGTTFKKADGLTWTDSAGRTFTLSWSELKEWVGVGAQSGRLVPKGFPRSNSFGPAFWW
jgi:hypothetical protein